MKDTYLKFVNSPLGAHLARSTGLPRPRVLKRYRPGAALLDGMVAIGAGPRPRLLDMLATVLGPLGAASVAHAGAPDWLPVANRHALMAGRFDPVAGRPVERGERLAALLFDASGIEDSAALDTLFPFFHDTIHLLADSGRVIVLGRPPEDAPTPRAWTAQRALEGFTRALGKELRGGASANLLYVGVGADAHSCLRFFLSARSAYVSGQVVRITGQAAAHAAPPAPAPDFERPLAGRRALVTGAARGIGAAIAAVLARDGAMVVGLDIPQAGTDLAATLAPFDGVPLAFDIAAPDAPAGIAAALFALGGVDIVVHNAGITRDKTIVRMSEPAWHTVLDINLGAQERIDAELLDSGALHAGGRIIGVSSISGIAGNRGQTNYATSKAGVIGRVQSMAPMLATRGITINAVAPGFIETDMTARIPLSLREAGRRMNSLAQGGQPVDVAETIAWLAQPGSADVTGQVVRVCGQSLIGA